jgi:hypothetical protein
MFAVCKNHVPNEHSRLRSRLEFLGFRANVSAPTASARYFVGRGIPRLFFFTKSWPSASCEHKQRRGLASAQGVAMACWRCPQLHRGLVQCCLNFWVSKFEPFHPDSIPIPMLFHDCSWLLNGQNLAAHPPGCLALNLDDQPRHWNWCGWGATVSALAWWKWQLWGSEPVKRGIMAQHLHMFWTNHWTSFLFMAKTDYGGGLLGGWVGPIIRSLLYIYIYT